MISINANSKIFKLDSSISIFDFLLSINQNPKRCLVELNGKVVKNSDIPNTILQNNDKLEIIRLVAGG